MYLLGDNFKKHVWGKLKVMYEKVQEKHVLTGMGPI